VLVPALVFDIGPRVWWPSRLRREEHVEAEPPERLEPVAAGADG
jgi:RND superfamily putative drug exporter